MGKRQYWFSQQAHKRETQTAQRLYFDPPNQLSTSARIVAICAACSW
jgi:hypothetical protein